MTINYEVVRTLLTNQLKTVATLPAFQAENTRLVAPVSAPWCRLSLLPASPNPLTVGPNARFEHIGIAQIDLFYPQDGGTTAPQAMGSLVMQAMPPGFIAVSGNDNAHIRRTYQRPAYQVERWYVVPVVVEWASFATAQ